MSWSQFQYQMKQKDGTPAYPLLLSPASSSPYTGSFHQQSSDPSSISAQPSSSGNRISPGVLFTIVVLAVLFFISGFLHLLVRFLLGQTSSSSPARSNQYPENLESEGRLQNLFHLHDCGLDQAFIDALPVFHFKEIVGLNEPVDCAVCLTEFFLEDKLRLLPVCGHAFHINCIDTWLLSNSTCPLCRATLFTPGFPIENPVFDFEVLREEDRLSPNGENGGLQTLKTVEIQETGGGGSEKGVFPVRLGKFRKVGNQTGEAVEGETSSSNLDGRRCYSMGSVQYVVRDANLRVALWRDQGVGGAKLLNGIEEHGGGSSGDGGAEDGKSSCVGRGDSFSVSKIWLWPKRSRYASTSSDTESMEFPWMDRTQAV